MPWLEAGYSCLIVDTQLPSTFDFDADTGCYRSNLDAGVLLECIDKPKLVIAFPPCTDLAVSGAVHFESKRLKNPGFQEEAVDLAKLASTLGVPYIIENPVSVLSTMWRKPNYYFHPSDYGGYLTSEEAEHPDYPEYIAPYDAYPKKTGIWHGNGAVEPAKKPVERPKGYSTQHKKLGGKSLKTKNIRSATARGWSRAVFEANEHLLRQLSLFSEK
tara:strand:- start:263 stop:910 length:648 start_codon:yes stop_codon:yes gene_type:complete